MNNICIIGGTRPFYIKMGALIPWLRKYNIKFRLFDTGQHYSENMSEVFIKEFKLPIERLDFQVINECQGIVVSGDTNSTMIGACIAGKYRKKLIHIEAGMRCGYDTPEEYIRTRVDWMSDIWFCSTKGAVKNNTQENEDYSRSYHTGDLQIDLCRKVKPKVKKYPAYPCCLLTIHRQENMNKQFILKTIKQIFGKGMHPIFPVHPRTKKILPKIEFQDDYYYDPFSYKELLSWIVFSTEVWTDSGGIQKEAFFFNKPCKILRPKTEWHELQVKGATWQSVFGKEYAGKRMAKIIKEL